MQITIEGRQITISFNILLLGKDEAVLGIPQLQDYNLKLIRLQGKLRLKTLEDAKGGKRLKWYSTRLEQRTKKPKSKLGTY